MTTTGYLNERGLLFYLDRNNKIELKQDSFVNIESSGKLDLFLSIRHSADFFNRTGKIFTLREEFRAFLIDSVNDDNGVATRSYSSIDSIDIDVEFDRYAFTRTVLLNCMNMEFFRVLELISLGIESDMYAYKTCVDRDGITEVDCESPTAEILFEPLYGFSAYKPYTFLEDFFKKDTEDNGLPSIWSQLWARTDVYSVKLHKYLKDGFNKSVEGSYANVSYNFVNNIYPEDTKMLDFRWNYGGYDITPIESKAMRTFTYSVLTRWYGGGGVSGNIGIVRKLYSNDDWSWHRSSSSSAYDYTWYAMFDGAQSQSPGINEFVCDSSSGEFSIGFPNDVCINRFRIRVGVHEYSSSDRPKYLKLYASNNLEDWTQIWIYWGDFVKSDGTYSYADIDNRNSYKYYKFTWSGTGGGSKTRISDFQFYWGKNSSYDKYNFDADEKTVRYFTELAKTDTYAHLAEWEPVLIDLLGPPYCCQYDDDGNCLRYAYGGITSEPEGDLWDLPEAYIEEEGELPLNSFVAIKDSGFGELMSCVSQAGYDSESTNLENIVNVSVSGDDAFYALLNSGGKILDRKVYNGGVGNEYRYGMRFSDFLEEQGWSIDDFMFIYSEFIDKFSAGIQNSLIEDGTIRPVDFCEFYDIYHRCPFDGIRVYIPMVPRMNKIKNNGEVDEEHYIKIIINKAEANEYGSLEITGSRIHYIYGNDLDLALDKDEYIAEIYTRGALKTIVSDFMRISLGIQFKSSFENDEFLKLRVSTSDYTYMTERYFDYVV